MKVTVHVRPKPGILDPQGGGVRGGLDHLRFAVREARVGHLIDLDLDAATAEEARAAAEGRCRQLLANPLIESYEIDSRNGRAA